MAHIAKSKPQITISRLKIPIKSQIPVFPQVHKHELRSVQQRTELAICQCYYQCYSIACLKCVWLSLSHHFQSQQQNQLKLVNSTCKTNKHRKGLTSITTSNGLAVKFRSLNRIAKNTKSNGIPIISYRIKSLNCRITPK